MRKPPRTGRMDIVPVCLPVPGTRMVSGMRMGSLYAYGDFHPLLLSFGDPVGLNSSLSTCFSAFFALLNRARARAPAFGLGTGTNSRWKRQSLVNSHRQSRWFSIFNQRGSPSSLHSLHIWLQSPLEGGQFRVILEREPHGVHRVRDVGKVTVHPFHDRLVGKRADRLQVSLKPGS